MGKYCTTTKYNKFLNDALNAKIKSKTLVNKSDVSRFINNPNSNKKNRNIGNKSRIKTEAR